MMDADLYVGLDKVLKSFVTTDSYLLAFHIQPFGVSESKKEKNVEGTRWAFLL